MRKPFVRLENWATVPIAGSLDFEPLEPGKRLVGNAFGYPNLPGRTFVWTSRILSVDGDKGLVETANTIYRLGKPKEAYAAWQNRTQPPKQAQDVVGSRRGLSLGSSGFVLPACAVQVAHLQSSAQPSWPTGDLRAHL